MVTDESDWLHYPGGHHVRAGIPELLRASDLGDLGESALLLLMAQPKLRQLGIVLPAAINPSPNAIKFQLLTKLERRLGSSQKAHAAYKSLQREIISFARTYGALPPSPAD